MKKRDKIVVALKNVFHNKKNILNIIILSICFILVILSLSAYKTFDIILLDEKNNFLNQIFFIDYENFETISSEEVLKKVRGIEHVVAAYPKDYFETSGKLHKVGKNNIHGNVVLYGINNQVSPKIIAGRNVETEGEIVCPVNFYPYDDLEVNNEIDSKKVINMKNYLNQIISFNTDKGNMTFKLVGVFQNLLTSYDENKCYIMFSDIIKVGNIDVNNIKVYDIESKIFNFPMLIIDDLDNFDYVEEELHKIGVTLIPSLIQNKTYQKLVKLVIITIFSISVFVSLLILTIMIGKYLNKNRYNISLLRVLGYDSNDIFEIIYYENLIINFVSFIFSFIISIFIYIVLNFIIYFKPYFFDKMIFSYSYISLLICVIFVFIMVHLVTKLYKDEILNINIIDELRG